MTDPTIGELGEIAALERTRSRLKAGQEIIGSGDDAAELAAEASFLVSTDTMVEDHDFRSDWSSGFDLGFKAIASNLADIAAMGAKPTGVVVAIVLPGSTRISFLESFADGLQGALDELSPGIAVVGGDISAGEKIVVSVTAFGELAGLPAVRRSGARVGDRVAVAGVLGKAAIGLALLESGNSDLIASYDEFVAAQLRPRPPIGLGVVANAAAATSMLDISDGLLIDALRIAKASGVGLDISTSLLKGFEAIIEQPALALGVLAKDFVLSGGEDHSLLATFSGEIPKGFKEIGRVVAGAGRVMLDGIEVSPRGWDSVLGS